MGEPEQNTAAGGEKQENLGLENVVEDKEIPEHSTKHEDQTVENTCEGEEQKEEEEVDRKDIQEDSQSTCSNSSCSPSSTSSEASSSPSAQDAPRVINMEDSDKKYGVVEPTKPKTWLAAYK